MAVAEVTPRRRKHSAKRGAWTPYLLITPAVLAMLAFLVSVPGYRSGCR